MGEFCSHSQAIRNTCILSNPKHSEYYKVDGFLGGFGITMVDLSSLHFETHQSDRASEGV